MNDRQRIVKHTRRLVIKIGGSVLTNDKGVRIALIQGIARQVASVRKGGIEVVIVSSGAIACGMGVLKLKKRPHEIPQKQAVAAIGQPVLVRHYSNAFQKAGLHVAQILLTRDDLKDRHRFLTAKHAFAELFRSKAVPVVNENDSVAVEEIQVGDNDQLSALVSHLVDADLLLILTDIDGFYDKDPRKFKEARRIGLVENVDEETFKFADDTRSEKSTGGMTTKLKAAYQAAFYGVPTWVVGGEDPKIISKVMVGDDVGTLFLPRAETLSSRKYWIGYTLKAVGKIVIDEGAAAALTQKKKSLLPSGILEVEGDFDVGDAVEILNQAGKPLARGLAGYHSRDIEKIRGQKSTAIEKILGYKYYDEVVNRDDLVIL
ncbi:MAG: glutamate 5-kinase [Deltaproteobacteria bacterium]|nr:glutamate 5-kinase [Deltaproteobacteria bacterium]